MAEYSMANRKIAYTLGRGRAYISDMSSTSGYMGATYFQNIGPSFFDMSSASGYMGAKYFQEFGPIWLAYHVPNVACHGVSISIVSISSVSCRVRILRVRAMSWPPCSIAEPTALEMSSGPSVLGKNQRAKKLKDS